jgi:GxxExxY protein
MSITSTQHDPLTRKVIGEAMYVHRVLGPGFLESIYHNALFLRLKKLGLKVESQQSVPVYFDGEMIGDFIANMIVDDGLILELKAVSSLNSAHEVQLVNYLTATNINRTSAEVWGKEPGI